MPFYNPTSPSLLYKIPLLLSLSVKEIAALERSVLFLYFKQLEDRRHDVGVISLMVRKTALPVEGRK